MFCGVSYSREESLLFKDDSPRLSKEYQELNNKNPILREIVDDVAAKVYKDLKEPIVITQIFRTQKEQDRLYRYSGKYKRKKFKSPHQFYQAIDLRSWKFSRRYIRKLKRYINKKYNEGNYYRLTFTYHAIKGNIKHIHIQFAKP